MQELNKLNIPQKINIGFRDRGDTYTGKLAFIVYTDNKGVLRKQKSWDGWRDHKIDPKEFDNTPTSGFVLNKKVGGTRYSWNPRNTWIRVWDPRDFEFEVSVPNLLFILQETSAIKGKGLDGEFVYAWDGADLVLLPVDSQEYRNSAEFTGLQTKKVSKKEMKEGCLYLNKDTQQVMYLGRHDFYELKTRYRNGQQKYFEHSEQHIFVSIDGKSTYWAQDGFTKLASRLGIEPSPLFAEEFEKFKNSNYGSPPLKLVGLPCKHIKNDYSKTYYLKKDKDYYPVQITTDYRGGYRFNNATDPIEMDSDKIISISNVPYRDKLITQDEVDTLDLYTLCVENTKGSRIPI